MTSLGEFITGRWLRAWAALAALCLAGGTGSTWAKTPDGLPPSAETVCSSLKGAAFGLCNAYCEAQDCDVHPRPSCAVLRKNFEKITGSSIFPCDLRCGNGTIDPGEQCDPPGSPCGDGAQVCSDDCTCPVPTCGNGTVDPGEDCDPPGSICGAGRTCTTTCTCPMPMCGDGVVDPGEQCDPPGSPCADGTLCTANCSCVTEPTSCCECPAGTMAPMCQDGVTQSTCLAHNCQFAPGTTCDPTLGRCVPPPTTSCCRCPNQCITVVSPDQCPTECTLVPAPSNCDAAGNCVSISVP